jgi:hypothetical protein
MERKIKSTKNKKTNVAPDSSIKVMVNMLDKASNFSQHIDSQTNILLGISLAVFSFSATKIHSENGIIFYILGGFSAIASIISLYAIHPPIFMRKRGQKESLFYSKKITSFESENKYCDELENAVGNYHKILREYSSEIYNIYKYYYQPKRKLFKFARNALILGILFGIFSYIIKVIIAVSS